MMALLLGYRPSVAATDVPNRRCLAGTFPCRSDTTLSKLQPGDVGGRSVILSCRWAPNYLASRSTLRGCLPPRARRPESPNRSPSPTPLTLVAEVSSRLAGGADLASVLPAIAESVRDGVGARQCGIWRKREDA